MCYIDICINRQTDTQADQTKAEGLNQQPKHDSIVGCYFLPPASNSQTERTPLEVSIVLPVGSLDLPGVSPLFVSTYDNTALSTQTHTQTYTHLTSHLYLCVDFHRHNTFHVVVSATSPRNASFWHAQGTEVLSQMGDRWKYMGRRLQSGAGIFVSVFFSDPTPGLWVRVPDTHSHPAGRQNN